MSTPKPHAAAEFQPGLAMGMRGCVDGEACSSLRPGHELHPMQERLSRIAASRWLDAVVTAVHADGVVELVDLDGGARRVWHHDGLHRQLAPGDPVAFHEVYDVLARGEDRFSVAAI
ncbi:hypothetical protein [Agromyces sp. C10]|uniref:hypothetical protein n=1 Tax=Agromyces sp. C10 TaxID=2935077 RepID=UPI00200A1D96|nr:hypothetical protein [Agromyces sp. C10]MCK8608594.1 hypothetical protein [Agromyces sp. C10]